MADVDVVIVGGGIAGLWTLRALQERCPEASAVLVVGDRGLGGGQTSHSHAMLHRGHYQMGKFDVPEAWLQELPGDLAARIRARVDTRLQDAARMPGAPRPQMEDLLYLGASAWEEAGVPVAGPERLRNIAAYLVDAESSEKSHLRLNWNPQARQQGMVTPPRGFEAWEVVEDWVDPTKVVRWLLDDERVHSRLVSGIARWRREADRLVVETQGLTFSTSRLIVAGGQANEALLEAGFPATVAPNRFLKPVLFELVMRGPTASGPRLLDRSAGGIRWTDAERPSTHNGLLSSHPHSDGNQTTWVFTDGRDVNVTRASVEEWLRPVVKMLVQTLRVRVEDLAWCVRERTMFELQSLHDTSANLGHWTVEQCTAAGTQPLVLFAWPAKLTLVPLMTDDLILRMNVTAQHPQPDLPSYTPVFAAAPWDGEEPFSTWPQFAEQHRLADLIPR